LKTDHFVNLNEQTFSFAMYLFLKSRSFGRFMAKFLSILLLLLIRAQVLPGQEREILYTLYLVGDAGEEDIIHQPLGGVLRQKINESGSNTTLIFLGDNIYPTGMPDPATRGRGLAEKIIHTQVSWIRGLDANGVFIPGNHDWQKGKRKGLSHVQNQQQWLDSLADKKITLLPRDGCPGPVVIPLTEASILVVLDTQWLLHQGNKPGSAHDCEAKSPADVWAFLRDVFARHPGKRIILAAHHPLITYGEHGGVFRFKDHIFPLTALDPRLYIPIPLLGSIYPLYRKWFGNIQDVAHPAYKEMSMVLRKLMADYPGTIYAAGHEHALEYLVKDSTHFIVSGSGSKSTHVKQKKFSRYAESVQGFAKMNIHGDGSVVIEFWRVDKRFPQGIKTYEDFIPPQ
jgi:Calcineurin-like phosphoesterase